MIKTERITFRAEETIKQQIEALQAAYGLRSQSEAIRRAVSQAARDRGLVEVGAGATGRQEVRDER